MKGPVPSHRCHFCTSSIRGNRGRRFFNAEDRWTKERGSWFSMSEKELLEGMKAPDFTVPVDGKEFNLYVQLGRGPVVLYFYPRDFTAGCTAEACEFRDSIGQFRSKDAFVIGVSGDSSTRHKQFAERHGLDFMLISDAEGSLRDLYGVKTTLGFIPGRTTFVIDRDGTIVRKYSSQLHPKSHVNESLDAITDIKQHNPE